MDRLRFFRPLSRKLAPVTDEYSVLLLHMDGTDESTSFPDSALGGAAPHTVTAQGNAQVDTAQTKFGTGSGLFDGTGDYLSIPDNDDFDFGSGDWTIECWLRITSRPASGFSYQWYDKGGSAGMLLSYNQTNDLYLYLTGTNYASSWTPALDTWHHVAVTRAGDTVRMFVGGLIIGTHDVTGKSISNASDVYIGDDSVEPFNGWLDEYRITKGLARYIAEFDPPTSAFSGTVVPGKDYPWFDADGATLAFMTYNLGPDSDYAWIESGGTYYKSSKGSLVKALATTLPSWVDPNSTEIPSAVRKNPTSLSDLSVEDWSNNWSGSSVPEHYTQLSSGGAETFTLVGGKLRLSCSANGSYTYFRVATGITIPVGDFEMTVEFDLSAWSLVDGVQKWLYLLCSAGDSIGLDYRSGAGLMWANGSYNVTASASGVTAGTLRCRRVSSTVYWDYMPDGGSWTNLYSNSNSSAIDSMRVGNQPAGGTSDATVDWGNWIISI